MKAIEFKKPRTESLEFDVSDGNTPRISSYTISDEPSCFKIFNSLFQDEQFLVEKKYFGNFVKALQHYAQYKGIKIEENR